MVTIYSASAGTGKTHTLTGEYLTLLFKGTEGYRHILAVTFTNKATAEMKSRIIEELSRLADENQPSDYLAMLSSGAKKDEQAIRGQARKILINILHDYSAFNISTIDHFFQRTMRSFTREIGLQGNYKIELDHQRMLEDSVDSMMSELEESKDNLLMDWLLRFIEEKIDRGKDWDIKNDIISLGNQLFKEDFKSGSEALAESLSRKPFLKEYQDDLYKIMRPIENLARELGERGLQLMERHGLQASDFKGGSRSAFYRFEKLAVGNMEPPSATFCALLNNVENYYTKKASPEVRQACESIYNDGMNSLINSVLDLFDNLTDYYTAKVIARNFYALGILADLSEHISGWRSENNKMHISDTTELLNKIIGGSDIPFIYEKTGTRIDHYMIDEFQDTSAMQWANFRPLIKDSLDSGRSNLIVGDVKQSIYRFRNSDWSLLDRKVKEDFAGLTVEKQLAENWRSCRNIVNFNNMIFDSVPYILQLQYNEEVEQSSLNEAEKEALSTGITSAYKGATQKIAPPFENRAGHVRIEFLTDEKERPWKEQSMERLPLLVEQLQAKGYELRDIAILVRNNDEGVLAAETLLGYSEQHPDSHYRYDIITEDSLTVNSSISVRWIVAMLRYIEASPSSAKAG
ncbi:MAG: UvrD-helicase domain-containing protein, partial [Tannerella sp.]|nr:UvrD-helicase domain-containing protein [Tannerella sp.]